MQPIQHRILCIDNHASSNLAVYLLERVGYEVRSVSSIADGVKLAQSEDFDLQLINHTLVDESEIECCDRLDKFASRTPILFYSTVLYTYEPIQAIHCRQHRHALEPVYVYDVVGHASRLLEKKTRSVNRPLRQGTEIKAAVGA
jgi:DNA-binding NtrC family response regulator